MLHFTTNIFEIKHKINLKNENREILAWIKSSINNSKNDIVALILHITGKNYLEKI